MPAILALDQGTTSSRAILFDPAGRPVGVGRRAVRQIYPRPGWVEHDPVDLWQGQQAAAAEAMAAAGLTAADVAAIGVTNQRETTVVWDRRTGAPVYNAIVWQDRRTADVCAALTAAGHAPLVQRKTGLVIDPYFAGTKLRWVLDHVPGARGRAERGELAFGTIDSWLLWNLTGGRVHATDVSNASRTMLFDIRAMDWDDELLALLGVPRAVLPEVRSCSEVYGEADAALVGRRVPVAALAGDQQAALFGQACFAPGLAKATYGTGSFVLMHTGGRAVPSTHRLLTTVAWRRGPGGPAEYAAEGSVFVAGAAVQWLRDGLGVIKIAADVEPLAASVPDSGGVYVVPAFAGLGAPQWDPYARGTIVGLTGGTTAAHLARATLDAIAFQVADVLDLMHADSGIPVGELRADGGAAANDLLMQTQADLLGAPVVRPKVVETTALGAAYLAGLAVGVWRGPDELAANWAVDRRFEPALPAADRDRRRARWRDAVRRAGGWEVAAAADEPGVEDGRA